MNERRNDYPAYHLTAPAGKRPADLNKTLGLYNVPGTMYLRDVTAEGTPRGVQIAPVGMATYGAVGRIIGAVLGAVAWVVSQELSAWARWRVDIAPEVEPVTSTTMQVRLLVSPMRASWAELLLCKWAARNGWSITPDAGHAWIDPRNLELARKDNSYPYPWKLAKGYSTAKHLRA